MYVRIVTFGLTGITADQYEEHATAVAGAFTEWPGLQAKFWLADRAREVFGGVYLFDSASSAEKSRTTPLFAALTAHPGFINLAIEEFDTLATPTRVTAAPYLAT